MLFVWLIDLVFFFFNDTATTEIYTLSLHDALPVHGDVTAAGERGDGWPAVVHPRRSEEHTSELQSHVNLVCRLLLETKKLHQLNWEGLLVSPFRPCSPGTARGK